MLFPIRTALRSPLFTFHLVVTRGLVYYVSICDGPCQARMSLTLPLTTILFCLASQLLFHYRYVWLVMVLCCDVGNVREKITMGNFNRIFLCQRFLVSAICRETSMTPCICGLFALLRKVPLFPCPIYLNYSYEYVDI